MEKDDFIANLLLSKASVGFLEDEQEKVGNLEVEPCLGFSQAKEQYMKLRQKAIICRASKSQKALYSSSRDVQVA